MELEGNLSATMTVADILQFLGLGGMTGRLNFAFSMEQRMYLMVIQGKICSVSTLDDPDLAERVLVSYGLAERSAVEDAHDNYVSLPEANRPRSFLTFLVMQQRLEKTIAEKALQILFEDEVLALFRHKQGSFDFEKMDPDSVEVNSGVRRLDVDQMIMEGTRRADEWARCIQDIPDFSLIPCLSPLERRLVTGKTMNAKDWKVYSLINNSRSVNALCRMAGLGEFATVRALHELMQNRLIRFVQSVSMPENKPSSDRRRRKMPNNTHDTVVTLLGDMVNSFAQVMSEPLLFMSLWHEIVGIYPYADILVVCDNKIDTAGFIKAFFLAKDDAHLIKRVTSDCKSALLELLCRLCSHYAMAEGTAAAGKLSDKVCAQYRSRENTLKGFFPDFSYALVVSRLVESAALTSSKLNR